MTARLAAAARRGGVVRGRPRAAHAAASREAENHARLALDLVDDDVNVLHRRRRRGARLRAGRARRVRRGARAAARAAASTARSAARCGRSACATPARGCGSPRATSSAPTPRRWRRARCARSRAARTRRSTPWRSTAALALAHLGRREEAAALADAELALAERFGAPVPIAAALHARAVAEPDHEARVALCERALDGRGARRAARGRCALRLELGSALASLGRRVEARDALRPALADADAAGAVAARPARPARARGDRPAPAPRGARRRRRR